MKTRTNFQAHHEAHFVEAVQKVVTAEPGALWGYLGIDLERAARSL
jgi:hypothetical protein